MVNKPKYGLINLESKNLNNRILLFSHVKIYKFEINLKTDIKIDVIYILAKAILIITILSILLKQDENEQKEIKTIIIISNAFQTILKKDNILGFSQILKIKYEKTKK